MKKIAVIGSSGGNLFNLGGKEPLKLLGEIVLQAESAGIDISDVLFVKAESSMDGIKNSTLSQIYSRNNSAITCSDPKNLSETNIDAEKQDQYIAKKILNAEIDALVLFSADPEGVNKASISAATVMKLPIVGTGGASMAAVQAAGGNVLSVSGTTGTTNRTRAISSITVLSKYFNIKYRPVIGSSEKSCNNSKLKDRISIRGIMMASLPAFIAMALMLAAGKIPGLGSLDGVFKLLIGALPVVVAAIAAKQVSGLDEVGIVSGVIAGAMSVSGGILGGILGGIMAGIFAYYMINKAFEWKLPATTANIIAGGFSGLAAGLIIYFILAPVTLAAGNGIRDVIEYALNANAMLAGLIAGLLIWPAIIAGIYHAAILPIVLIEMEKNGMSFLGAVDMAGLVMVSAGITLANIIYPAKKENRSIAVPGFLINVGFGTFVEAAYPFMFSNKIVMVGAIIASGIGGLLTGMFGVLGTAYVPSISAPMLSNNPVGFIVSMLVSMLTAMVITVFANKIKSK